MPGNIFWCQVGKADLPAGGLASMGRVTYLSWHWIFSNNVPIGAAGIVLVTLFIDEMKEPTRTKFDLRGLLLAGTALACLMFGIEVASRGVGQHWAVAALLGVGVLSGVLYTVHARHHPRPMLDFRLLRIETFRMSLVCDSLSRIAVGAMPFLLPMMLQIGFGVSAAKSGMITFVSSVGSLAMRTCAPSILKRLGFRPVLTWVGTLATAILAVSAAFRPSWPLPLIYAVLVANGFFQSLQFMAYNTIAYADVPREAMSAATSFYTTFQQMSLTLGIAISAAALAASMAFNGHAQPMLGDFSAAFLFGSAVSFMAPLLATRLDRAAGAELSGHRTSRARPGQSAEFGVNRGWLVNVSASRRQQLTGEAHRARGRYSTNNQMTDRYEARAPDAGWQHVRRSARRVRVLYTMRHPLTRHRLGYDEIR